MISFRNVRLLIPLLILLLSAIAATCLSQETRSADLLSTDTALSAVAVLEKLEEKYRETRTFEGEFTQLKVSQLFLEEIKSRGSFWYEKPGRFRCEYDPPNVQVNLVLNDTAYIYIPDIKQVEIYRFHSDGSPVGKLNQMLLGFGVSVKDVQSVYNVTRIQDQETPGSWALLFRPVKPEEGLSFDAIRLWINRESLQPEKIIFDESGGDRTEILMQNIRFNRSIKDTLFKPEFPKDAEIIEQN